MKFKLCSGGRERERKQVEAIEDGAGAPPKPAPGDNDEVRRGLKYLSYRALSFSHVASRCGTRLYSN